MTVDDTEPVRRTSPGWTPRFPHARIEELLARVGAAETASLEEARTLLVLVAEEAERLRRTVAELTAARLDAAEEEADRIVEEALRTARDLRRLARSSLEARLTEAEQLSVALRALARLNATDAPDRPVSLPAQRDATTHAPASRADHPVGPSA